jgi:vacuolar protein sorting-associated protein 54
MDTLEVHLINSISAASASFFSALGSLGKLDSEAAESVKKIKTVRKDLASLDVDVVIKGLELLQKRQRHHNLHQIDDAALQLKRIVDRFTYCKLLIDEEDVEKALVEIDAIELLMAGKRDEAFENKTLTHVQLRDLRGAAALQEMASELTILRSRIGKAFESKAHSLLIGDLRRHVRSVSTQEVLLRWEAASLRAKGVHARQLSSFPAYMTITDEVCTPLSSTFPVSTGLGLSRRLSRRTGIGITRNWKHGAQPTPQF